MTTDELRAARQRAGLSISEAARLVGVSVSTMYRWEATRTQIPTGGLGLGLAAVFVATVERADDPVLWGEELRRAMVTRGSMCALWRMLRAHFQHHGMA